MALLNTYIAASAGAGKTYQLVSRFIALLSLQKLSGDGIQVSTIIAITFTRKAAAEFKARILADLAKAAQSTDDALSCWDMRISPILTEMGISVKDADESFLLDRSGERKMLFFTEILTDVMNQFAQLNLGTIDSLFQRMARTLCAELGLARLTPLDPQEEEVKRRNALDITYEQRFLLGDAQSNRLLEEAIASSLGSDSALSHADTNIFELVNRYHEIMLSSPDAVWGGDPDTMTEEQLELFGLTPDDISIKRPESAWLEEVRSLISTLNHDTKNKQILFPPPEKDESQKGHYIIPKRAGSIAMHHSTARFYRSKFVRYVRSIASLNHGLVSIEVKDMPDASPEDQARSRYKIYWDICREQGYDLSALLDERRAYLWRRLLLRTQALKQLLREVEHNYAHEVRKQGLFSFSDVARLLDGNINEQSYALVQERLDAKLQHWLLDEFQDTSYEQYDILRDLLLARAQEGDDGSVFMVGDAKQSIYQFRGGDPRVFLGAREDIFGLGEENQARSKEKPLNCSYRSAQAVLDFANELFGPSFRHYASIATEDAHQLWDSLDFQAHQSSRRATDYTGEVEIWEAHREADFLTAATPSYQLIAEILDHALHTLSYSQHESSCAILVSTRSEGLAIYKQLLELDKTYHLSLPIVFCVEQEISSECALGQALSQLFNWLLCPEDKQSLGLLRLSPLWELLLTLTKSSRTDECWEKLRELTASAGIAQLLRELSGEIQIILADEAHLQKSWKIWFTEAEAFDERGGCLREWVEYIKSLSLRNEVQGDAIRIMTIHQSKGLEFDCVIIPFLSPRGELASFKRRSMLQYKGEHGKTYALLVPPSDENWAMENTVLYDNMIAPWRAQEEFASFCKLYVAVTRAKRATYIIYPKRASSANKASHESFRHIMEMFVEHAPSGSHDGDERSSRFGKCVYRHGSLFLNEEKAQSSICRMPDPPQPLHITNYSFRNLTRRTPSSLDEELTASHVGAAVSSSRGSATHGLSGAELGLIVHAVMQEISWIDEHTQVPPLALNTRAEPYRASITDCIQRALHSPSWREHFSTPDSPCRLYREQNIEALSQGNWISGQIDRLHVHYDASETTAISAHIYDYKTNAHTSEEQLKDHYREQMRAYRRMVALAFHLSEEKVGVTLLHCPLQGEPSAWTYSDNDW